MSTLKKREILKELADRSNVSIRSAERIVNNLQDIIIEAIANGDSISLPSFASFEVKETNERTMFNPKTGEEQFLPAGQKVTIRPLKQLKDAVKK